MNNLETYITRIENIEKGKVEQYLDYLNNKDHSNHLERTEIISSSCDTRTFYKHNKKKIIQNRLNKTRGVKLKHSNKSLTFNLPKQYESSVEQSKTIQKELMNTLIRIYKENGVEVSENDFYTNIHKQDNEHFNFIIPYLDNNGKTIRFIKSKDKFYKQISKEFTSIVDNTLGTNINQYKIDLEKLKIETKETKKELTITTEKLESVKDNLFDNERILKEMTKIIESDLEDIKYILERLEILKSRCQTKETKTLINYLIRTYKGVSEDNQKKIEKNERLAAEKFDKIFNMKLKEISINRLSNMKNSNSNNKTNSNSNSNSIM